MSINPTITKEIEEEEKEALLSKIAEYIKINNTTAFALAISLNELKSDNDRKITPANLSNLKVNKLGINRARLISKLLDKLISNDNLVSKINKKTASYIYCYLDNDHVSVKPAQIIFEIEDKEWSKGTLKYFDIADEKEHRYDLKRNKYKDTNDTSGVLHYYAVRQDGKKIDFLTINIKQSTVAQRKIVFLTDSVLELNTFEPSCGYGILVAEDKIDNIEDYKKNIPAWISNTLRYKKITLSKDLHPPFESVNKFLEKNKQFKNTSNISGYYEGFFIHLKDSFNKKIKSKYYRIILHIEETGAVYLYDKIVVGRKTELKEYVSRLSFPIKKGEEKFLKINIEVNEHTFVSRLDMWLQTDDEKLEGIMIGFPTTKNEILISTILFNPIDFPQIENQENLLGEELNRKKIEAIGKYNLGRVTKNELNQKRDFENELTNNFADLNIKFFSQLNHSLI